MARALRSRRRERRPRANPSSTSRYSTSSSRSDPEVAVLKLPVRGQLGGAAAPHHEPFLEDVVAIGHAAERFHVLVDDEERQALGLELRDRAVDLHADE